MHALRSDHEPSGPDFRLLLESAPAPYLVLTPDLAIVAVSDAYLRVTMTERAKILGRGLFEVFPDNPDEPGATGTRNLRASLGRVLKNRAPDTMAVQKYDIRRPESEGGGFEERHWSPINTPVMGPDGNIVYIIHRVEDVTDFVRMVAQKSEDRQQTQELRARAKEMESEIYLRTQEVQEVNRRLQTAHDDLEDKVRERTSDLLKANEVLRSEIAQRRQAEKEAERLQAQLIQSRKMEAIGRLAGGIAHDFNNLLTAISGYSEFLLGSLAEDDPRRADVLDIQKAGQRAAALTHQLLTFSRQQVLEPRVIDLNAVVTDLEKMLKRLIGEDIDLVTLPGRDLGAIKADPSQITQVLLNLVVNARDAMPRGGKITIETANVEIGPEYTQRDFDITPGPHVMLAVIDNGSGMDSETLSRVFEPFFTTKEHGKGTGLGLATVYGIVKQSGGSVFVYSEPGRGSTFKVYLPRTRSEAGPAAESPSAPETLVGTETILLVEDDESVQRFILRALQQSGYSVLVASGPKEALASSRRHEGPIHLLLTDVVMPEMQGSELARTLCSDRPETKVLYMSGYTDGAIVRHDILSAGAAFLQKPLTVETLARKLREVLDKT